MVLTVMKRKQIIKTFIASLILAAGVTFLSTGQPIYAQEECGGAKTAIISCSESGNADNIENTGLWYILNLGINILTGLIAVAALFGIVYGAVLYTSAGGNQEQVKKAIGIFTNVGIGIIAYALMYIALNFLIPGGAF